MIDQKKSWWGRLPRWAQWSLGILGAVIILIAGVAIGSSGSNESELKDEVAVLETKLASAETEAEAGVRAEKQINDRAAVVIEKAKVRAERVIHKADTLGRQIFAAARQEKTNFEAVAEQEKSKAAEDTSEAETMEAKIASLRGEVGEAKEYKAKSTIPGNGTFVDGKDYETGTYESSGGQFCEWEADQVLGGEANGEGFNEDYGVGEEHILIEISSPYFKTSECGTWHRVSE